MKRYDRWILTSMLLVSGLVHAATGTIDPVAKYVYAENAGYINFAPSNGGVAVTHTFLSGFAWCESVGWIKLGSGNGPYTNTNSTDWGVNVTYSGGVASDGMLSGYGWSETTGWINFASTNGGVTIGASDGKFDGYAWSETVGWLHFNKLSTDSVQTSPLYTPPVVPPLASDDNPGFVNQTITYTFTATSASASTLSYVFTFFDDTGSTQLTGTFPQGTFVSVSHVYAVSPGDAGYPVTLTVSDGATPITVSTIQNLPLPASGGDGVINLALTAPPIVSPTDGLGQGVIFSSGGVIQLGIDISSLIPLARASYDVSTDWGDVAGRSSKTTGTHPVHSYVNRGLFVAKTTVVNKDTKVEAGKGRITLAVSSRETGDFPVHGGKQTLVRAGSGIIPNDKPAITTKQIKGKFDFTGKVPDLVTFQGTIKLPPGLDLRKNYEFWIALGNIVVKSTISKGKGTDFSVPGIVKSLKITTKAKITYLTVGGEEATINVTYSAKGTVTNGFDTDGISNRSKDTVGGMSAPRKIQVAMLVDGAPFQSVAPVDFSMSKGGDLGTISGRSGK
ncbi:MAG: hypothetical protein WCT04_16340 [Planctomycetota bacterium]